MRDFDLLERRGSGLCRRMYDRLGLVRRDRGDSPCRRTGERGLLEYCRSVLESRWGDTLDCRGCLLLERCRSTLWEACGRDLLDFRGSSLVPRGRVDCWGLSLCLSCRDLLGARCSALCARDCDRLAYR